MNECDKVRIERAELDTCANAECKETFELEIASVINLKPCIFERAKRYKYWYERDGKVVCVYNADRDVIAEFCEESFYEHFNVHVD